MTLELWTEVDRYIVDLLVPTDTALEAALAASTAAGLPSHNVSPNQGKFLQLLAQIQRARNILEIGTLGGYSTIWLARALPPGGRMITLEVNAAHANVARINLSRGACPTWLSCGRDPPSTSCPGSNLRAAARSIWFLSTPTSRTTPNTLLGH